VFRLKQRAHFPTHVAGYLIPNMLGSCDDFIRLRHLDVDRLEGLDRWRETKAVEAALVAVCKHHMMYVPSPRNFAPVEEWLIERLTRLRK